MDPIHEHIEQMTRRYFFGRTATGIGMAALASLLDPSRIFGLTGGRVGPGTSPAAEGDRGVLGRSAFSGHGPSGSSTCR